MKSIFYSCVLIFSIFIFNSCGKKEKVLSQTSISIKTDGTIVQHTNLNNSKYYNSHLLLGVYTQDLIGKLEDQGLSVIDSGGEYTLYINTLKTRYKTIGTTTYTHCYDCQWDNLVNETTYSDKTEYGEVSLSYTLYDDTNSPYHSHSFLMEREDKDKYNNENKNKECKDEDDGSLFNNNTYCETKTIKNKFHSFESMLETVAQKTCKKVIRKICKNE